MRLEAVPVAECLQLATHRGALAHEVQYCLAVRLRRKCASDDNYGRT